MRKHKLQLGKKAGEIASVELVPVADQLPTANEALGLYFEQYAFHCPEFMPSEGMLWMYFREGYFLECFYELDVEIKTDWHTHPHGGKESYKYAEPGSVKWKAFNLYLDDELIWSGMVNIPRSVDEDVKDEEMQEAIDNI